MAPGPARILQLSDLHLTPRRGRRAWRTAVWDGFDRVVAALPRFEPIDRLVLTGDLANRSSRATYGLLRETLAPWRDRMRLIPGNHDGRGPMREVFAPLFLPGSARFVEQLGAWRLIGLDSKRRFCVHGRLGAEQLRWLADRLAADVSPTLLFLHHPPMPVGTWWLDKDAVRDAAELAAVVRGSSVRAVFCGHVHQEFTAEFAGVPLHACPSTAYQFAAGSLRPGAVASRDPALRVIDVDGDRFTTRVERLEA